MTLQRRTGLARTGGPARTAGLKNRGAKLKQRGARAARRQPALDAAYAVVDRRSGGFCEANVPGVCKPGMHEAHDRHHMWTRNTRPDKVTDPTGIIAICRTAHDWAGANPEAAVTAGVSRRAWMET